MQPSPVIFASSFSSFFIVEVFIISKGKLTLLFFFFGQK